MSRDDEIRDTLAKLAALVNPETEGPLTEEVIDRYCAHKRATNPKWLKSEYRVSPLRLYFGKMRVSHIDVLAWDGYAARRLKGDLRPGFKISPITVTQDQDLLRGMLNWATDRGIIRYNPLSRVKRVPVKPNGQAPLREEDVEQLIANAPNLMAAVFIIVGMDSGLRRIENIKLQWSDIDFDSAVIHVRCGKGDKARHVVSTSRAMHFLRMLPRDGRSGDIYTNPLTGKRYSEDTANLWMATAVADSGIEKRYGGKKIRIHALRHGHATNAVERGVDIRAVQANLGHSSLSVTEKYLHDRMDHRISIMKQKFEAGISLQAMPRKGPRKNKPLKNLGEIDVFVPVVKKATTRS